MRLTEFGKKKKKKLSGKIKESRDGRTYTASSPICVIPTKLNSSKSFDCKDLMNKKATLVISMQFDRRFQSSLRELPVTIFMDSSSSSCASASSSALVF